MGRYLSSRSRVRFLAAVGALLLSTAAVRASTIAAFADPSPDGSLPMFNIDLTGNLITGGWSGGGLLLTTPGIPAPDYPDATFVITPLSLSGGGPLYTTGPGSIVFYDKLSNPLLTISFAGGFLTNGLGFGGSDFVGSNVTMTGAILPYPVSAEAFSFSFANPTPTANGYTVTSSFTSSAVPEPGSVLLLLAGAAIVLRRAAR